MKFASIVLGGYVNSYSILQELKYFEIENIFLFHYPGQLAKYSNIPSEKIEIELNADSLHIQLTLLHKKFDRIILFPTDDLQLENLFLLWDKIKAFCFIPFNRESLTESLNKRVQYDFCKKLNIPYPKTIDIISDADFDMLSELSFPILIKPNTREDLNTKVFRSLIIRNLGEVKDSAMLINTFIKEGFTFIGSEIVPGDTNGTIYAYTAYRSPISKKIENEWVGKKLTQYPDDYGVFSTASNEAPVEVLIQGRKLLNEMDLYGICEPEFKYDYRDKKYKLMEINLRSMMWHRVGFLSNVYLHYSIYLDAIGMKIPKFVQDKTLVKYCYLTHEVGNLVNRKGYWNVFYQNVFSKETQFALWQKNDPLPFIYDQFQALKLVSKGIFKRCLKVLRIK